MKKIFYIYVLIVFAFVSCTENDRISENMRNTKFDDNFLKFDNVDDLSIYLETFQTKGDTSYY